MSLYQYLEEHHTTILQEFFDSDGAVAGAVIDRNERLIEWNAQFANLAGAEQLEQTDFSDVAVSIRTDSLPLPPPDDSWMVVLRFHQQNENQGNEYEFHIFSHDNEYVLFCDRLTPSSNQATATMSKINQEMGNLNRELRKKTRALKQAKGKIEKMARTDKMTDLANRRHAKEEIDTHLSASQRHGFPVALAMADVDDFKHTNDTYGHEAGDDLLKAVAAIFRDHCRNEDLPARWGGDEFLILMPHTSAEDANQMTERIRQQVSETCCEDVDQPVTVSIGVTEYNPPETEKDFLKRADDALYQAKEEGSNRVCMITPTSR